MMDLIDKVSVLMEEIEAVPQELARDIARELLVYAGQIEDYELAREMEDLAYKYLKKW